MGRKRKNPIYFYYIYNEETNRSKCQMDGCAQDIRGHHSGNLLRHFYTKHRDEYNRIQARALSDNNASRSGTNSGVLDCCVNLVTIHGRPLTLIEDEAFQTLIAMIPNCPSTSSLNIKNLRTYIENKAYDDRNKLHKELKNKLICLKVDVASVKSRRFLGINLQYISEDKLQLRNLGVIELHERNTAEFLKDTVLMVLSRYGIEAQQIYSITSDNGANMLAMSRQIEEEIQDYFDHSNSNTDNFEEAQIDYFQEDDQDIISLIDSLRFERENVHPIVTAVRCAAHTLQLAVRDACTELEPFFVLCRRAVRSLRTPNVALELKQYQLLQAVLDCPTRWDSTVVMLERLMHLKAFCEEKHQNLIDHDTWTKIENTLMALKPCKVLSKKLQEEQLTFGDFYIAWVKCITELENMSNATAAYLVICMKDRENNLITNDTYLSAIYLDPRVNSILSDEQNVRARNHLLVTYQRYENLQLQLQEQPDNENNQNQINIQASTSTSDINSYFERQYRERRRERPSDEVTHLKNSLIDFLNQPFLPSHENVLKYWFSKRLTHPKLFYLSNIVLAAPPTQVSVERLFSSLKFILSNLRMSLKDTIIDDILVVRNNSIYDKTA